MLQRARFFVLTLCAVALFAMARNDLASIRALTTDTSFFTTQLAEVTRLEKEMLQFRSDASSFVHGYGNVSKDQVQMSFDLLWSRLNTQWTKFVNPEIDALRNFQGDMAAFAAALKTIDADVTQLAPGDYVGLSRIEAVMHRYAPGMTTMNSEAYRELVNRSVDAAVLQRQATRGVDRFQWIFLIVCFIGFIMLLLQLRSGEKLYASLQQREQEIRALAVSDPLTGLHNRRHFDERMKAIDDGHWPDGCGMLLIDLDGFKQVNDAHGHEAGDHLLREVARRLRAASGHDCVLARLGGDEFGIILSGGRDRACRIASSAIAALQLPVSFAGQALRAGASIGIAMRTAEHVPAATMLRQADAALYRAKAEGRNRFVVHQDLGVEPDPLRSAA